MKCPHCHQDVNHVGRPYNFRQDIQRRYKINLKQLCFMQIKIMDDFIKTGDFCVEETQDMIRTGDLVFMRPKQPDESN